MIAELLQIGFLAGSVLALSYWAERPAKRKHCDICARRNR